MRLVAAFLAILIASVTSPKAAAVEQAVIVHFQYGSTDLGRLFALESLLEKAIADAKAGEYDGNEIREDGSDGFLYMYGPDADRLFEAVIPVLKDSEFMGGATVKRRYGPPDDGVREQSVTIPPHHP
jgi:hypothetical protein